MNNGVVSIGGRKTWWVTATLGIGLIGIGVGSILGGGTVYYFLVRRKLTEIFAFQRSIRFELDSLRAEIHQLKSVHNSNSGLKSIKKERRTVKFAGGYETGDDEEYVTASSSDSEDDPDQYENLTGLARRAPGAENLFAANSKSEVGKLKYKKSENQEELFFSTVDKLFEGDSNSQKEAFEKLKLNETKLSHSSEFWWRHAKAAHLKATTAGNIGDRELKKKCAFDAFSYSEKALELNSECANVHKWYAITLGSMGEFISTNEKIQNGYKFKEHIDKAITISPMDSTLHYLMGRFCYEISQLTWIERQVASTLFSTPPSSSYEEALEHFQSAEDIGKPFKDNRLFMAKCYIGMSDYYNAGRYLNLGSNIPVLTPTDKSAQDEINSLMQKYKRYIN